MLPADHRSGPDAYDYPPPPSAQAADPYADDPSYRRADDNVSAPSSPDFFGSGGSSAAASPEPFPLTAPSSDGLNTPRAPSPPESPAAAQPAKTVQFDLNPGRNGREQRDIPSSSRRDRDRDRDRDRTRDNGRVDYFTNTSAGAYGDGDGGRRQGRRGEPGSPVGSDDSGETVELPPRFDEYGRPKADRGEDLFADRLEDLLAGRGTAGRFLNRLTGDLLGGSGGRRWG